jgi:hypothetical protein
MSDEPRLSWTQAICERCWFDTPGYGWPENELNNESATINLPHRVNTFEVEKETGVVQVEKCAFCGGATVCGIFVRVDPKTVSYPKPKED